MKKIRPATYNPEQIYRNNINSAISLYAALTTYAHSQAFQGNQGFQSSGHARSEGKHDN